jgi:hypothetical protein
MVHLRQSHLVQIDLLEPAVNLPTAVPAANSSILEILDGFQKPGVLRKKSGDGFKKK